MALTGTFTVRVQKPGAMLAEAMSEMRVWLDHHHIELVDFGITETSVSGTAFNLCFRREAEASLCSVACASPHPMIVLPLTFKTRGDPNPLMRHGANRRDRARERSDRGWDHNQRDNTRYRSGVERSSGYLR